MPDLVVFRSGERDQQVGNREDEAHEEEAKLALERGLPLLLDPDQHLAHVAPRTPLARNLPEHPPGRLPLLARGRAHQVRAEPLERLAEDHPKHLVVAPHLLQDNRECLRAGQQPVRLVLAGLGEAPPPQSGRHHTPDAAARVRRDASLLVQAKDHAVVLADRQQRRDAVLLDPRLAPLRNPRACLEALHRARELPGHLVRELEGGRLLRKLPGQPGEELAGRPCARAAVLCLDVRIGHHREQRVNLHPEAGRALKLRWHEGVAGVLNTRGPHAGWGIVGAGSSGGTTGAHRGRHPRTGGGAVRCSTAPPPR
mmetsp:Transcript_108330/g.345450  ORF Transcript_108330/g.345450 Transcript_108330/m.345450 type:complete len:312 (+) Transcript_108330:581-1516(+)